MTFFRIILPADFGNDGPRDAAIVRDLLEYRDGKLFRKVRTAHRVKVGDEAGTVNSHGYVRVKLAGLGAMAHRLIWLMHNDEWPKAEIDHLNGVRGDNRIENLRDVPATENQRNAKLRSDNVSGVSGVRWDKRSEKWLASIKVDGRNQHLGSFDSIEDAANARRAASQLFGFTDRHGTKP